MKLARYCAYALFYVAIVLMAAFALDLGDFTLSAFGLSLTLPTYQWLAVILLLFFAFSYAHFAFYALLKAFRARALLKDALAFKPYLIDLLLEKESKKRFKSSMFIELASLSKSALQRSSSTDAELSQVLGLLARLELGEVVDLKPFKLDNCNPLFIKNEANRARSDESFALQVLKGIDTPTNEVQRAAFAHILSLGSFASLKHLKLEAEHFSKLAATVKDEELLDFLKRALGAGAELLELVPLLINRPNPGFLLSALSELKEQGALKAYLYALAELLDFETLEKELLKSEQNYKDFEPLLLLREHGLKYDTLALIK